MSKVREKPEYDASESRRSTEPARLDSSPTARAFSVEELMREVSRGTVRVPPFQRGLRWERDDARNLVDSIYRGYPVGTLLFWKTEAKGERLKLGSLRVDAPARRDALLVVDGQQRITSLARILLPEDPTDDPFALFFELESEKLVPPNARRRGRHYLPLTVVLDSEELLSWLFETNPPAKLRAKAIHLGKRIREYRIPAYLVESSNEAVPREIFQRLNTTGKALEASEIFDAIHGSQSGVHPASLGDVATEIEKLGFGRPDDNLIYRALLAVSGHDVGGRQALRLGDEAAPAYAATLEALEATVLFLKNDADIPHQSLLPYKLPVLILSRFFHLHPSPQPRSRDLLARWVWRGAWSAQHQGATVSTRSTLALIVDDEERAVQALLGSLRKEQPAVPDGNFNFRFAASKLQALALAALEPRNLASGETLDVEELATGPHAFRQMFSADSSLDKHLVRSVANRFLHPAVPSGLRRSLSSSSDRRVWASHAVDDEAIDALRRGRFREFLERRQVLLEEHLESFLARHARWNEPDRPSITSLVVSSSEEI